MLNCVHLVHGCFALIVIVHERLAGHEVDPFTRCIFVLVEKILRVMSGKGLLFFFCALIQSARLK